MAGLARICKAFGRMQVQGTMYVWDYAADEAVPESDMPFGSKRHATSERARLEWVRSVEQQSCEPTNKG